MTEPSPNELAAAVDAARRHGWDQDDITLAGWIVLKCQSEASLTALQTACRTLIAQWQASPSDDYAVPYAICAKALAAVIDPPTEDPAQ